jgi:cysteinyl-tRNA synthetase
MELFLFNSQSNQIEPFKPLQPDCVKMYHCGPTVYNYAHIGNLRTYIIWDVLRRVLQSAGFSVHQVTNITDFGHLVGDGDDGEDKMTKALIREGRPLTLESMKELGEFYAQAFLSDLDALGNLRSHAYPRASDYIQEDIALIHLLEERGFVYRTSDGLYFDTSKDPEYGMRLKSSSLRGASTNTHNRIESNSEKKSSRDFALWKFNDHQGWESPWGKGFPGWHIECSAMSCAHLGQSFDIHTGGKDHISVHHTNEIAQSENAFGVPMAQYWLHANFLTIHGEKISKSLSNELYLQTLVDAGFHPRAYRYFILGAHYRSEQHFSWEALEGAATAFEKLQDIFESLERGLPYRNFSDSYEKSDELQQSLNSFMKALSYDLTTPSAIAIMWDIVRGDLTDRDKYEFLVVADTVLGLGLGERKIPVLPENVARLIAEREQARRDKAFEKADQIRNHVYELGFTLEDSENGPLVHKRRTLPSEKNNAS